MKKLFFILTLLFFSIILHAQTEKMGLIDFKNNIIIPLEYDNIFVNKKDRIEVLSNNEYNILNDKGKALLATNYRWINYYSDKMIIVSNNDYHDAIITIKGDTVIPFMEQSFSSPGEGLIPISREFFEDERYKGSFYGYIDFKGKTVIPFNHKYANSFEYGHAVVVSSEDFWNSGLINKKGEIVIPYQYRYMYIYDKNEILVEKDQKKGFVDFKNNVLLPIEYTDCYSDNKFFYFEKDSLWGVADKKGNIVAENIYNSTPFNYGFKSIIVSRYNRYGSIDKKGNLIIPFLYEEIDEGNNKKYYAAKKDGQYGLIDCEGNIMLPFIHDKIEIDKKNRIITNKDGVWKIINLKGETILDANYEEISYVLKYPMAEFSAMLINLPTNMALVRKNGLYGIFDMKKQKEIIPCIYYRIFNLQNNKLYVSRLDN